MAENGKPKRQRKKPADAKKVGRPRKISQVIDETGTTVSQSIVRDLTVGAYLEDAAARAGVSGTTVYRWIEQGNEWVEDSDGVPVALEDVPEEVREFREFRDAVEKARAEAVMSSLAVVRRAAQGVPAHVATDAEGNPVFNKKGEPVMVGGVRPEWTAAAWYLERVRPDQFGRRDRHEITGEDGGPVTLLALERAADKRAEERAEAEKHSANGKG